MDANKTAALRAWLAEQIAACEARRTALWADERQDEANFARIRANIFAIFRTILSVAEERPDGAAFFAAKLTELPAVWRAALDRAEQHDDATAVCMERIKLEAAEEIRIQFETIGRDTP